MPIELEVLDGGTRLVRKLSGHVTRKELISSITEFVASDEDVRRVKSTIFDSSEVESMDDVSSEDIRAIAELNKRTARVNPNVLVAHISPKDAVYGLSRMWQTLLKLTDVPWKTQVFRSREEVASWLREQEEQAASSAPQTTAE